MPEGEVSDFHRCLTTLDLVVLGVSSTLGNGVYLLTGDVARAVAGPSTIISFVIAAVTSFLTALCFAELGTRVPKAGASYIYSYVAMGEIWAFITGWTALMSYIIGTSSLAKAWSVIFDELTGKVLSNILSKQTAMHVPGLAVYPDFFAAGFTIILVGILAFGVKEVASVHRILLTIDLLVILFVTVSGFIKGNIHNWAIIEDFIKCEYKNHTSLNGTTRYGHGGFFPFGFKRTIVGTAACFTGYCGFDCIAQIGEQAQNPEKSFPVSIVVAHVICFLSYLGVSAAMSLMMPYYLLSAQNPLSVAFAYVGWIPAKYVVSVAALCALLTSLLGTIIQMVHLLFAMSRDGVLFRFLSKLNNRQSPFIAIMVSAAVAAIMALLFDLTALTDMMAMGVILSFTFVVICILKIRHQADFSKDTALSETEPFSVIALINPPAQCTPWTSKNVSILTGIFFVLAFILSFFIKEMTDYLQALQLWSLLRVLVI
ncbi:cationic amino acid transporter 2 family protein [Thalassophryne amazonica]|uniref:cationic amino acid transporter 2 family protein n=1 Tax=Thalassophryne amazonica TaxID=390379 RepID=UPI001472645E|nr:cationic amino acid transporter 2 family protein [Thalassophryne amazonica]